MYKNYKTKLFSSLLREDIPEDDKHRIKELLNKPWNPYIGSALNTVYEKTLTNCKPLTSTLQILVS